MVGAGSGGTPSTLRRRGAGRSRSTTGEHLVCGVNRLLLACVAMTICYASVVAVMLRGDDALRDAPTRKELLARARGEAADEFYNVETPPAITSSKPLLASRTDSMIPPPPQPLESEPHGGLIDERLNEVSGKPPSDEARRWPRIYCLVPTMFTPQGRSLMNSILQTWGPECDVLKFFVDPDPGTPKYIRGASTAAWAEVVQVPMVRKNDDGSLCPDGKPCRHIWEKVWRMWVYVAETELHLADWFCKIDDDSFFLPANLRRFVAFESGRWSPDDPHWFGHRFARPDGETIVSGVSSAFSRETVRRMAEVFRRMPHEYGDRNNFKSGRCVDRDGATEERTTALCLNSIGIRAELGCDAKRRERVLPLGLPFTVTYPRKSNTTGWYWNHKPPDTPDLERCCAPDLWGTHGYKVDGRMRAFHWRLFVEDFGLARERLGLPRAAPSTWPLQEEELYALAHAARREPRDEWFALRFPKQPHGASPFAERSSRDEWFYAWYILLIRTSLLHNPFRDVHPLPQMQVPADAVVAYGHDFESWFKRRD